jgi:hypothetical protein
MLAFYEKLPLLHKEVSNQLSFLPLDLFIRIFSFLHFNSYEDYLPRLNDVFEKKTSSNIIRHLRDYGLIATGEKIANEIIKLMFTSKKFFILP